MAKKFNLADYLRESDVPRMGTEQIVRIDLDRIDPDPANFYSLDGIEDLAGNIELVGLLDALRVRPNGERFTIVSGHRRRAACMLIRDGGNDMFADGVPCIVEYGEASDAMRELRLIFANSATRKMSAADVSKQAERVTELLYQLKEQGVEFPGRMRDHVAEAVNTSKSRLGRLHAIRGHLDEPMLRKFDAGELKETVSYALAQKPVEQQREICDAWKAQGRALENMTEYFVNDYAAQQAKLSKWTCKLCSGGPCINRDSILARIFDGKSDYKPCRYGTCCSECSSCLSCKSRCPFVEDKAKKERERQRAENKALKAAEQEEAERKVYLIEHLWAQFGAALKQAGLTDKQLRASLKGRDQHYSAFDLYMDEKRKADLMDFSCTDVKPTERLPFFLRFGIDDYMNLCALADALGVSLDYLFLRDSIPNRKIVVPEPASMEEPRWIRGDRPEKDGRYFCLVDLGTSGLHEQRCEFQDGAWSCYGRPIEDIFTVKYFWPLPPQLTPVMAEEEEEEEDGEDSL